MENAQKKIWFYTIAILMIGLSALFSASYHNERMISGAFINQLVCIILGLGMMFFLGRFDYKKFYSVSYILYGVVILLLILVMFMGRDALGARRWIEIAGVNFQPSELAKLAIIFTLARYYSTIKPTLSFNWHARISNIIRGIVAPFLITVFLMFFIYKQPDLGTSLLILFIFIAIAFASGANYKHVLGFLGVFVVAAPFFWGHLKNYQKDRLLVFLNPNIDPLGAGYTIIQSKIAVGSGKIFGKGWLSGTQNHLNFLPERHTDFIYSVIGEEWGLIGTMSLIILYFLLIMECLKVCEHVKDKFGMLMGVGIISILTIQVIINIGMVIGLFPIVGLTLPFVSYGRSSLIIFMMMIGLILSLSNKRTIF